jgi:tripartite-type tricarboxylate transporter receptor subunit TctC
VRASTPPATVSTLYAGLRRVLERQDVRDTFQAQGIAPGGMPPAEFDALFRADLAQWKRTVQQLHLTLQ